MICSSGRVDGIGGNEGFLNVSSYFSRYYICVYTYICVCVCVCVYVCAFLGTNNK